MDILGGPFGMLDKISAGIKEGAVVVFPTETVYGIGAAICSEKAVTRIYDIKKRDRNKTFAIHISDKKRIAEFSLEPPAYARTLINSFMPGPVTIILRAAAGVPEYLTGGRGTVGFRLPSHILARELIRKCGGAIAATSANISGRPEISDPAELKRVFENKADYIIIDESEGFSGTPSTVLDCTGNSCLILREGAVGREDIEKALHGLP